MSSSIKMPPETEIPSPFVDGTIEGVVIKPLKAFTDSRGWLIELYRNDELSAELHPAMAYLSETLPGVARGPHEHRYQADLFAFVGPGEFAIYLWDIRIKSPTYGHSMKRVLGQTDRSTVLVPPGVVHAYKNVSGVSGWVLNLPNQLYAGSGRKEPVDEIRYESLLPCPFLLD